MAGPNPSADALLTEHFRYTPLSLIDDIINTVNTIVYRALTAVESGLLNTTPSKLGFGSSSSSANDETAQAEAAETARAEIEDGVHRLETLLEATVDKQFDKLEIYTLRNILKISDGLEKWIRLGHYENLTLPLPSTAPTPSSIHTLRQQLLESQKLNLALEAEHATTSSLLNQLQLLTTTPSVKPESIQGDITAAPAPLSFLASHPTSANAQPLTTSTQFTTSQLPALRTILDELRPKLQMLKSLTDTDGALAQRMDWTAPREDRRKYVDNETRRAVVGELGAMEGSGGDKGELGVSREQVEVEGLEGVISRGELKDTDN